MITLFFDLIDSEEDKYKFEKVFLKYKNMSMHICYSIIKDYGYAEDAVSETYLKIARLFYKVSKLKDCELKKYIKLVSKRTAIDMYRKRKSNKVLYINDIEDVISYDIENYIIEKEDERILYEQIALKLPNKYYDVMYMNISLGFTPKEIALSLSLDVKTIYKRLERARKMIKEMLEENCI